ncbi:TylF/MycF/NovP-related O-methyltransferase [Geodermatophilus sp. CPCC 206100]|uniref:TylF/MycF/NovP-related O-methyltransferase n=1 Tax=Geodermatophilus sp. CPCC 206100 TaxID=3020054 RepID=UPI003AFFC1A0
MLHSLRSAVRNRLLRAVREANADGTTALAGQIEALRADLGGRLDRLDERVAHLHQRVEALDGGLRGELRAWERRQRRDILTAVDHEAMRTSAEFLRREMDDAAPYFDKHDTLRAALERVVSEGLYLEFGVATGGTLRVIATHAPAGSVFGFDSFEGLPEDWRPGFDAGAFAQAELPDVPGAELVVGLFDDTLGPFLEAHPEPVAFLHLDADLYSSTRTVLQALAPRLRAGTVIVFDEYFNFPGWEEHEHRAWTEFVTETGLRFEYLGYTADDEQVAVRLVEVPQRPAPARRKARGSRPAASEPVSAGV